MSAKLYWEVDFDMGGVPVKKTLVLSASVGSKNLGSFSTSWTFFKMMDSLQQQAFSSPHQRKPLFPRYLAKVSLNDMIIENRVLSKETGRDRQLGFLSISISFCLHLRTAGIYFLNSICFLPAKLCACI